MSLKITIFEDDKDLADTLKEMLENHHFAVDNCYGLRDPSWHQSDIVLADFRNKIVAFEALSAECKKFGIPLIAISGAETNFKPQLLKPFTIEELESAILEEMMVKHKVHSKTEEGFSLFGLFRKAG